MKKKERLPASGMFRNIGLEGSFAAWSNGHSHFSTTANFYAHLDYDSKKDSANVVGGILMTKAAGAKENPPKTVTATMTAQQNRANEETVPALN